MSNAYTTQTREFLPMNIHVGMFTNNGALRDMHCDLIILLSCSHVFYNKNLQDVT